MCAAAATSEAWANAFFCFSFCFCFFPLAQSVTKLVICTRCSASADTRPSARARSLWQEACSPAPTVRRTLSPFPSVSSIESGGTGVSSPCPRQGKQPFWSHLRETTHHGLANQVPDLAKLSRTTGSAIPTRENRPQGLTMHVDEGGGDR